MSTERTERTETVLNGDPLFCTERTELSIDVRCGCKTKRTETGVFND